MAKLKTNLDTLIRQKYGLSDNDRLPSQEKISAASGITQSTVSRWMNGRVDRFDSDTLFKFCRFLGCNVGDLLYFEVGDLQQEPA